MVGNMNLVQKEKTQFSPEWAKIMNCELNSLLNIIWEYAVTVSLDLCFGSRTVNFTQIDFFPFARVQLDKYQS